MFKRRQIGPSSRPIESEVEMAEGTKGLKITRPGTRYYFDGAAPACPACNSNNLEYRCRVRGTPRTAEFKCLACSCKFEKTRTLDSEPEGYTPELQRGCTTCRECGTVLKDHTDEQL